MIAGRRLSLVAVLWLAAPVLLAEDKPRRPWQRDFDLAEIRVEGLVLWYEKPLKPRMDGFRATMVEIAKKEAKRAAEAKALSNKAPGIIQQINTIVGFSPTEEQKVEQRKLFLEFLDMCTSLRLTRPGRTSTFYFITMKSVKDYLHKGGKLPCITYDKATDMFTYLLQIERRSRDKGPPKDAELLVPIPADMTGKHVSGLLDMIGRESSRMLPGMVVHELAEITILMYRLKPQPSGAYIRWFSDGFANAIAIRVLKSNVGEKEAAAFAKLFDIAKHAARAKTINLQYWLPGTGCIFERSDFGPLDSEGDLSNARYSFATHEAVRLIDRHGIGCVAKILDKARPPNRRAGAVDILAAVTEVTGEDMAKRLLRYQSFKTRQEGLAMYTKRYKVATARKDHREALIALLRMYELPGQQDMRVFDQVAQLLIKLGHRAAADRVLKRGQLCRKQTFWLTRKEAEGGDTDAMYIVGKMYEKGLGVEMDLAEAVKWYRKAAEAGHPRAMLYVGWLHEKGTHVERDFAEAARWYRKAADAEDPTAMYYLGNMYMHGLGVEKDLGEAGKWYARAAVMGHPDAMHMVGVVYGRDTAGKEDLTMAVMWFRMAAHVGHAKAMIDLGLMHAKGRGVKKDMAEAVKWFHKAAYADGPPGMNRMGLWYAEGKHVKKDLAEAVRWYRKAAEDRYPPAMYNLADAYEKGLGVKKDKAKAARWYREAAEAAEALKSQIRRGGKIQAAPATQKGTRDKYPVPRIPNSISPGWGPGRE